MSKEQSLSVEDGNRLIAEFMENPQVILVDLLEYHSSWDWLMPVVDKLKQLREKKYLKIGTLHGYLNSCWNAMKENDILKCFNHAAEAIQWYNTQSKK